ncbi:hypothetical protein [Aquimarina sp. 2201CG14-23]|uniref:hypothetical protein n=1 Tax=Aquimarina mycalae TaxID=3040073 RepID=UPI002477ED68|nr:hypothetical protein [Aquimarina sp. 2201CG14-23]MDH7446072.1 hypothetical protein [Aquimarina sp. 2201CG14-23]
MKLLFTFCLITSITLGQNNNNAFQNIKKQFTLISELKEKNRLTEKEIPYFCKDISVEGLLTYYYKDKSLKLIVHAYDQGHYTITHNYYVQDEILFFYFSEEHVDNDTSIHDKHTGELLAIQENWSVSETRIYFDSNEAIKCLTKGYDNINTTKEIRENYERLSDHFKNKEIVCNDKEVSKILSRYSKLIAYMGQNTKGICPVHM